jgi:hypothetical protein
VSGYGPSDLQSAYNLASAAASAGSGQTVALVDAYDDPNAEADLATYRGQFGLPPCTTANGCFEKLNQDGATTPLPYPAVRSDDWTLEESLDMDMVSAVCPQCHIMLVEADNADLSNMGTAVNAAVAAGAKFVSNSYAVNEQVLGQSAEAQADASYYDHPGVVITAASGDWGYGQWYPAASPDVTAVGGTSLLPATNARGWTESVWSTTPFVGTGSGCSLYEAKPSWQGDVGGCADRSIADVSAVADPATGVAVYDTFNGEGGWNVVGGTSVATPLIAAVYALAGTPATGSLPAAYPYSRTASLYDVSAGASTTCNPSYLCAAKPGYDGPTGLGTPDGTSGFTSTPGNTIVIPAPGTSASATSSGATSSGGVSWQGRPITEYYSVGVPIASMQLTGVDSAPGQTLAYTQSGLPPGLSWDPATDGISGTPTQAGTYFVTITATDASGAIGSQMFTVVVAPPTTIRLASPGNQAGTVGDAVFLRLRATDSDPSQALSFMSATLPPGLNMTASGAIRGSLTTTGTYSVQVQASDETGASSTVSFTWTVAAGGSANGSSSLVVRLLSPARGAVGVPLSVQLAITDPASSGATPLYGAVSLPPGLSVDPSTGEISGTPTVSGITFGTVSATDDTGTVNLPVTWSVAASGGDVITITNPGTLNATIGAPLWLPAKASDSDPAQLLTYSASGLPPGLMINPATGVMYGTPGTAGTFAVTLTAQDTTTAATAVSFLWTISTSVHTSVALAAPSSQTTLIGTPVSLQLQATPSSVGQVLNYYAYDLPAGLSLDPATGIITGTPTTPQSILVAVAAGDASTAADSGSVYRGYATFQWTIVGSTGGNTITVSTPGPQGGAPGTAQSLQIQATDSDSSQAISYAGSGLPSGMSVDPATGLISGTPTRDGVYPIVVTVTDGAGSAGAATFTWTVAATSAKGGSAVIGCCASPAYPVGDWVSYQVVAGDSNPADTLSYAAINLPSGLTINPTSGLVSGTPAKVGVYRVTVQVTDTVTGLASSQFSSWSIGAVDGNRVCVLTPGTQSGMAGMAVSLQILGNDSDPTQALEYTAVLPPDLSINPGTGLISGTPIMAGSYPITVRATDTTGATASVTFNWVISG